MRERRQCGLREDPIFLDGTTLGMKHTDETRLEAHFDFGLNWKTFVATVDEEMLGAAMRDIQDFLGCQSLGGRKVLDVGCGSGLTSLAAFKLGAQEIVSIDIDPENIRNVERLKKTFHVPEGCRWQVLVVSATEKDEMARLPMSDLVISWGVLHHTGDMWAALDNTASLVRHDGLLYLMIYRDALLAPLWKKAKRWYVQGGRLTRFVLRNGFAALLVAGLLLKLRNPFRTIREYPKKNRGMRWYTDVTDWVGGYPFEYASFDQVTEFLSARGFGLEKVTPPPNGNLNVGWRGPGSYVYLFRRDRQLSSGSEVIGVPRSTELPQRGSIRFR